MKLVVAVIIPTIATDDETLANSIHGVNTMSWFLNVKTDVRVG
jgi:hypothetical protein